MNLFHSINLEYFLKKIIFLDFNSIVDPGTRNICKFSSTIVILITKNNYNCINLQEL